MSKHRALEETAPGDSARLRPEDLGIGVLFHVLSEAILVVDLRSGCLALCNPGAERLFQLRVEDAIGQPLERFLPDQAAALLAASARPVEGVALLANGALLDVEITLAPPAPETAGYHVLVVRDISERKALEAEGRQRAAQLAEAEHIAQVGSWLWDLPRHQVRWSDELYRIMGQESDRFTPSFDAYLELVHEDYRDYVDRVVRRALEDRAPFSYYARIVRPDGELRTLHCRGSILCDREGQPERMVGTVQDVTKSLRLEAALRESEAKLRAIVDQATDGIWLKDLAGRYVLINPAGAAITGRTVDEVVGRRDGDLYDPETARRIAEIDARILMTGERETYEIVVRVPDGGERVYFSIKYPFVREDGTIQGLGVITRDITERKRLQQTLHEQYERLKELDRLKNDFVNAVSHELRTPLTSIRGYLEFMEDGIGGTLSAQHTEFVQE
ncbi:MAG TPA: PAS domain S-box protein, partial [Stenomitos sp.]